MKKIKKAEGIVYGPRTAEQIEEIGRDGRLSGKQLEVFTKFINDTHMNVDPSYIAQWAKRFNDFSEWAYSDYERRRILTEIAPEVYGTDTQAEPSINGLILTRDLWAKEGVKKLSLIQSPSVKVVSEKTIKNAIRKHFSDRGRSITSIIQEGRNWRVFTGIEDYIVKQGGEVIQLDINGNETNDVESIRSIEAVKSSTKKVAAKVKQAGLLTRKPYLWTEVNDLTSAQAKAYIDEELKIYGVDDVYGVENPEALDMFEWKPPEPVFLLDMQPEGLFLVDTSGYDYARYVGRVIEDSSVSDITSMKKKAGSHDDFLMNYGPEIKNALSQLRKMKENSELLYNSISEEEFEKVFNVYDKNVGEYISGWLYQGADSRAITDLALRNQDRYGTEPQMILQAIEDLYNLFGRKSGLDLESMKKKADRFQPKDIVITNKDIYITDDMIVPKGTEHIVIEKLAPEYDGDESIWYALETEDWGDVEVEEDDLTMKKKAALTTEQMDEVMDKYDNSGFYRENPGLFKWIEGVVQQYGISLDEDVDVCIWKLPDDIQQTIYSKFTAVPFVASLKKKADVKKAAMKKKADLLSAVIDFQTDNRMSTLSYQQIEKWLDDEQYEDIDIVEFAKELISRGHSITVSEHYLMVSPAAQEIAKLSMKKKADKKSFINQFMKAYNKRLVRIKSPENMITYDEAEEIVTESIADNINFRQTMSEAELKHILELEYDIKISSLKLERFDPGMARWMNGFNLFKKSISFREW